MSNVGRKVTHAATQTVVHVPATGQLKTTLTIGDKGIEQMVISEEGLVVTIKGLEVLIPFANIAHMLMVKVAPAAPKAK